MTAPEVLDPVKPQALQQPAAAQGALVALNPEQLLQMAVQQNVDLAKLEKLMDLRDRWLADQARQAFDAAMARFKAKVVSVVRRKEITDGPLKGKKHTDLFAVVDAATEELSRHDLVVTFKVIEDAKDWIRIACRVRHVAGHEELTIFGGPVDTGPGRNAIQARKSSVSYLERITMLLALGLAEQDDDDDGAAGGGVDPVAQARNEWIVAAQGAQSREELARTMKAGVKAFQEAKDRYGYAKFAEAVQKRGAELGGAA